MTNIHDLKRQDDVMDEAYAWVLLFNRDTAVTSEELAVFREWVARSPSHKQALTEAENFWCEAEILTALSVPHNKLQANRLGAFFDSLWFGLSQIIQGINKSGAVAALLVLGIGISLSSWLLPLSGSVGNGVYATAIGEQKVIVLRDNSRVQLDTYSQVRVEYQDAVRRIHLLRGKAHFDVAKNPQRAFEVYARDGLVRAVGTAFSVYLTDTDIQVTVDEGRVDLARLIVPASIDPQSISLDTEAVIDSDYAETQTQTQTESHAGDGLAASLSAEAFKVDLANSLENNLASQQVFLSLDKGQSASFSLAQQSLKELSDIDMARELAWRKGLLVFARDPLSHVVSEVSRYTDTTIEIVDPDLGNLVMGGRFRIGELDALFEVLEIGFGVEVSYLNAHHVQLHSSSK